MKSLSCKNCGAPGLRLESGYWQCDYCGSKFLIEKEEQKAFSRASSSSSDSKHPGTSSGIALSDDVERLLLKCKTDRKNARKYANLILDIDPDNKEALKYF